MPTNTSFTVALGNFDGVHLAHQALLRSARTMADMLSSEMRTVKSAVWCFDPPSSDYIYSEPPKHLTKVEEKLHLFAREGFEYAFLADFPSMRNISPSNFIREILMEQCSVVGTVCGYNFHFGKQGAGKAEHLQEAFGQHAIIIPQQRIELAQSTPVISSSEIRTLLKSGDTEQAALLLGRPYALHATVVHGKQLGRTLGLPTINQFFPTDQLVPKKGIYASIGMINGAPIMGVSNIGTRPTVSKSTSIVNCETHLIGIDKDLYGKNVTIYFFRRLRDEMKFETVSALQRAILRDIEATKAYFNEKNITKFNFI